MRAVCLQTASVLVFVALSGCQSANYYHAGTTLFGQRMPDSLRLGPQANTQEVDLSRLASGTGSSETIGVGDVLDIEVAAGLGEDDQSKMSARVQDDGRVSLPEIGYVDVAGIEPQGAESLIRAALVENQLYRNPSVTVSISHQRKNTVRVIGAVKEPGVYYLPPNASDVVSALAAAGGLAEDAGQHLEIRNPVSRKRQARPSVAGGADSPLSNVSASTEDQSGDSGGDGMESYSIDLISATRASGNQYLLQDGGVVMVEKRDPAPVFVQGLVRAPNRYEYPIGQDLHLLDAISLAGGMSNQLADKILVIRKVNGSPDPAVIEISYREAKRSSDSNLRLGPGDVVSVEQTPATVAMDVVNIVRFGITGSTQLF